MTFNKSQKIITILYCLFLVLIFLTLTPYQKYTYDIHFGNFFVIDRPIIYTKFFIECGALTIIYYLSLIIFKSKP